MSTDISPTPLTVLTVGEAQTALDRRREDLGTQVLIASTGRISLIWLHRDRGFVVRGPWSQRYRGGDLDHACRPITRR
jgi:hypothetical protein